MLSTKGKMRHIVMILSLSIFFSTNVYAQTATTRDKTFYQFADNYFDQFYFPTHPTLATVQGIHKYDGQLEKYSKSGIAEQINQLKVYEAKVKTIDPRPLSERAQADRELLLNSIRSELLTLENIKPWQKNPDYYSSGITNSAFVIMERKFAPDAARLQTVIAREKLMPAVLNDARNNLENPPKIYVEIAIEQLPGLINFFRQDVPKAFSNVNDPALKKEFNATNDAVIEALGSYQDWLQNKVLPHANGDFRIGAENFRKKLLYDEMVDMPLDRLLAINMKDMQHNQAEYSRIAKELYPNKVPKQVMKELAMNHPMPSQLLANFSVTFDGLINFINAKQIITLPSKTRPQVQETPPFMRATTFASMDTPGPFENNAQEAYFNVTLPDPEWNDIKTQDFMRQFSYPVVNNISVHETYPGHYVQFLWMHNVQDRVRKILGAATNAEGWAHYCEQMMLDEGFGADNYKKLLRLGQLNNALLRNARFAVGIKMHTGKMTFDQAVDFFVNEGYQSHTGGIIEAKRGTSDPTYLYYTLGKLQILKLRHDLAAKQGANFNLKKFHDDFMSQGYPPIKIVRRALLQDDSPTL